VYRIECDDRTVLDTELRQQRLRCRDLIGFLGDIDVGEYQGRFRCERTQYLRRGVVIEVVEAAAQRLAIKRDAGLSGLCACRLKLGSMLAEDRLDLGRIEPLEDVADRGVSGRAAPLQTKRRVQPAAMDIDEGDDASIRIATRHDGKDGEQQHVAKLVFLPLPTARIRHFRQQTQQRRKWRHGNLQLGCHPRSQTFADSRIPILISRFSSISPCCGADSVQLTCQR